MEFKKFITLDDLLGNILTTNNILDLIKNKYDGPYPGNIYEKLFKIFFLFNRLKNYELLDKNFNHIINKRKYLENNILDSCIEGKIDIKLKNIKTGKYLFLSCKYFKEETDIEEYDIGKIKNYLDYIKIYNGKYRIGLIVRNKEEFMKKYNASRNNQLKNLISVNCIFDINTLIKQLKVIHDNFDEEWFETNKISLELKDYQINLIKQIDNNKNILIGCCPRCGKSYITAGYIAYKNRLLKLDKNNEKETGSNSGSNPDINQKSNQLFFKNILILTPCPKETFKQWFDIFNNYIEFNKYKLHDIKTGKDLNLIKLSTSNIIIISKQLLQSHYKSFNFNPDLLIFDEHDFHGTSELSQDIIKKYSKNSQNLYLTGTYIKSLINIDNPTKIIFNYTDLHKANPLTPAQEFLTTRFNLKTFKEIIGSNEIFDLNTLFIINKNNKFEYYDNIVNFINNYISNNQPVNNIQSIRYRINNIYKLYNQENNKYSQIWFLPENNIDLTCKNLVEILRKDNYYKTFDILTFNSKNYMLYQTDSKPVKLSKNTNIKQIITNQELIIKNDSSKSGLLILVGGMLQRGISLEHVNTVFFLNESESFAKYLQSTYRCLTEEKDKKVGIIVDFSINRVLSVCYYYDNKNINNKGIYEKTKYMLEKGLINLDSDQLETYNITKEVSIENIMNILAQNPEQQLNNFRNLLAEFTDYFTDDVKTLFYKYFYRKNNGKNNKNSTNLVNSPENQDLGKNKKIKEETNEEIKETVKKLDNEINEEMEKKKISKDVLPYVVPLSCVLTYNYDENKLIEILNIIKNNKILNEIFNDQCKTIWENDGLIDVLLKIVNDINYDVSDYIKTIKISINNLIDKPDKLIDFVNDCIKIKSCEREKNGEVLTPAWLVNQMLDKLEEFNPGVFKNKELKYFDHSAGSGIFMIELYKRLIKNIDKNHIIKNMLYISEYNKKNVFILKMIFGKNANINEGDTLKLNTVEKWNVDKFDIILGNPPYNSGGIREEGKKGRISQLKGNKTIWPEFIKYSFDHLKENGWLISINPLSWLKKNHIIHNLMFDKQIYYLELLTDSYSKKIINASIQISNLIIKNSKNNNKVLTEKIFHGKSNLLYKDKVLLNKDITTPLCYDTIINKLLILCNKYGLIKYYSYNKKSDNSNKVLQSKLNKNKVYGLETYTFKDGYIFKELTEKQDIINKPKLLLCYKSSLYNGLIDNGKYGICGRNNFYILNDNLEDLKVIKRYLEFKIFELLNQSLKYNSNFVDITIWDFIPNILNVKSYDKITENIFYKMLNLTNDEINVIKKF